MSGRTSVLSRKNNGSVRSKASSPKEQLHERALLLQNRMTPSQATSVVGYREETGDYGDSAEHSQEEWLFLSQNAALAKELRQVEDALDRLKEGAYGICARCSQPISESRLKAIPWAIYCVHCQELLGS